MPDTRRSFWGPYQPYWFIFESHEKRSEYPEILDEDTLSDGNVDL